jgi:hypothetical protein
MAAAEQLDGMISRVCFPVAESQSASSEKSQTDTEGVRKPRVHSLASLGVELCRNSKAISRILLSDLSPQNLEQ